MQQMLAALLLSQAESAKLQRLLLEREIEKDRKLDLKEAEAQAILQRNRKQLMEQAQIRIHNDELRIERCSHKDQRGGSPIYVISKHVDRRPKGGSLHCPLFIQPE